MKGVISKIKKGVVNVTSDIISGPAQYRSYRVQKQANMDTAILKEDRKNKQEGYRYNPNEGDHTDPKFRTHLMALEVKGRLKRNVKK